MEKIVFLTPNFAVTGQLEAKDFAEAARLGFKLIVNNRPDGEEENQLANHAAAAHAQSSGLGYHFNPAGKLDLFSDRVVDAAGAAFAAADGPVLAYCKSGMRCAIIWAAVSARSLPVDDVLAALANAGFDFDFLRDDLEEQALTGAPAVLQAAA
ncbi:MAG: TIGR01244 family sulfur transferase [Rhodomicrobium sp.]